MAKQLEITLKEAKKLLELDLGLELKIYSTYPELKPKPNLVDNWEDLENVKGFYISSDSEIYKVNNISTTLGSEFLKPFSGKLILEQ